MRKDEYNGKTCINDDKDIHNISYDRCCLNNNNNNSVGHAQLLTPQEKAQFCNPNNPKLKFVNSTESKICGIPTTSTNATNATTTPSSILAPSIIKATP